MTTLNMPAVKVSVDFEHDPGSALYTWVDLTSRSWDFNVTRGRLYELTVPQAGTGGVTMENIDGALDPTNAASEYAPNVKPFRRVKIEATWDGTTYPVYGGLVERWPMEWQDQLSVTPTQLVDQFALFAQDKLKSAIIAEMLADSPAALYPLDEPAGSTSAGDVTGNMPAATVGVSKYGAGTLTFGTGMGIVGLSGGMAVTSPDAGNNVSGWVGSSGPDTARATWLDVPDALAGRSSFALGICFVGPAAAPAVDETIFSRPVTSPGPGVIGESAVTVTANATTGHLGVFVADGGNFTVNTNICDGQLHQLLLDIRYGGTCTVYIDGKVAGSSTLLAGSLAAGAWALGVSRYAGTVEVGGPFSGSLGLFAQFATAPSPTRITAHYDACTTAFAGETADARIARILGYAGWTGATDIDACTTTVLGATDLNGQYALTAIHAVGTTEGGAFFIAKDGTPTYRSRRTRMIARSQATFGDGDGELPYEAISFDFDPTYVYNDIEITRSAGASGSFVDATSQGVYGERDLPLTMNLADDAEVTDAGNWLLAAYKDPHVRVATITLHPSAVTDPALWTACLGLEIGSRITVNRRPKGSPNTISGDYYVEQIKIPTWTAEDATFVLALSPVALQALIADDPVYGLSDTAGLVAAW